MNFKQLIRDYFTFSRNERKGITVLLVIIFLLAVANKVIFYFETPASIDVNLLNRPAVEDDKKDSLLRRAGQHKLFAFNPNTIGRDALDSLSLPDQVKRNMIRYRSRGGRYSSGNDFRKTYGVTDSIFRRVEPYLVLEQQKTPGVKEVRGKKTESELFNFDPNTSSDHDFMRLGLNEKQVRTIRNYQSKGGRFKAKADFLKIYGIAPAQQSALLPYVLIAENAMAKSNKKGEANLAKVEINGIDTTELMRLPGVGSKLLKRIVTYRDLLGGYYNFEQLKEVYGMNAVDFQQIEPRITIDTAKIHKVDLNFADWNELARHPYIGKNSARQIVRFRTRYGSIDQPCALRDSQLINPKDYLRLKPYL